MGVAGSYLVDRLSDEHTVVGYERQKEEDFDAVCAWGTTKGVLSEFAKTSSLNFDDYVYHDGNEIEVDLGGDNVWIKLKGLCTYDKAQIERDLMEGREVKFGTRANPETLRDEYDMIVDATALRDILPQAERRVQIPCIQYKVKYKEPPYDDFLIRPFKGMTGYFWYFPLEGGYAHIGAGDFAKQHNKITDEFMRKFPGEIVKKSGRPISVSPPSRCEPFYDGKLVGVGESIGTVFPMLGEGIIPSLQCSNLLLENLYDMQAYRKAVLEKFSAYDAVYEVVRAKIENRFKVTSHFLDVLRMYLYMKRREDRFGMEINIREMFKVIRSA